MERQFDRRSFMRIAGVSFWFTSDGGEVMNALVPYENVTIFYGHIHRENFHQQRRIKAHAARSLIFAFPDPGAAGARKPLPFDRTGPARTSDCEW